MPSEIHSRLGEYYYVCPLAGLQMDVEQAFIGDLKLIKLSSHEWGDLEKGYIHLEWHYKYSNIHPIYVYHRFKEDSDVDREKKEIDSKITNLISALRLYKHGVVHNPIFTVRFLKQSAYTHREVGPYREEYLTSIEDGRIYNLTKEEIRHVERIYLNLTKVDSYDYSEVIRNLLEIFNLTFLPTLSSRFRLSIAYTALEILYNVSPKVFHNEIHQEINLYQRAFASIIAVYGPHDSSDDWYKFYCLVNQNGEIEIHKIRKIVQHLKVYDAETNSEQALIFIQESLRLGIRMIAGLYRLQYLNRYEKILNGLTVTLSPKELLNLALHRLYNGDNQLLEKLLDT